MYNDVNIDSRKTVVNKSKRLTFTIAIIMLFVGAIGMYVAFRYLPIVSKTVESVTKKEVTVTDKGIADAVDKVYDSVVTVETYRNKQKISSGTGFVYKTDGNKAYIITNHHVIDGGDEIYLMFTDGSQIKADIVGSDAYADIAVLTVDKKNIISVAETGSSCDARVGDTVFTVGAPLDTSYSWTVTRGVISGKDRMVEVSVSGSTSSDWIMRVIQTDAAINSGNSGGPLCNSNGEVIAINSLKLISSGVEGMGFGIPIEDALEYASKVEKGEKVERPLIGITMIDLTDLYGLYSSRITIDSSVTSGVVVAETTKNGPAEVAGLQKGDVITKINGEKVNSIAELRYYLYKSEPGDTIQVTYIRDILEKTIKVKLEASGN